MQFGWRNLGFRDSVFAGSGFLRPEGYLDRTFDGATTSPQL